MAHEIKAGDAACAFRTWLGKLQATLNRNTPDSLLEAARILSEIESVAASWVEQFDVQHAVSFRRRHLSLSWLPRIGMLLGMLREPSFKDPILNPKGYLAFISSWYESPNPTWA
jgi:hypothetical protein